MSLHPCSSCGRHARHSETRCPFCDASLTPREADAPVVTRGSRAAILLGATLALGACTREPEPAAPPPSPPATPTSGSLAPPSPNPATQQLPTTVTEAPPPINPQGTLFPQPQIVPPAPNDPTMAAAYGAPPPPTPPTPPPAGPRDGGAMVRRYGAPPLLDLALGADDEV
jgi:hypothetical protein